MTEQIGNSPSSPTATLSVGINSAVTSLTVSSWTSPLPQVGTFRILIGTELISVGSVSGTTLGGLTRGIESTAAAAHSSGANVDLVLTAGGLTAFVEQNGGSSPTDRTQYNGYATYAANANLPLALGAVETQVGADLLDATDPTQPTVIAGGVYAALFNVSTQVGAQIAGSVLAYDFEMDQDGFEAVADGMLDLTVVGGYELGNSYGGGALTLYVPTGGIIACYINHNVAGGLKLQYYLVLQKLSQEDE